MKSTPVLIVILVFVGVTVAVEQTMGADHRQGTGFELSWNLPLLTVDHEFSTRKPSLSFTALTANVRNKRLLKDLDISIYHNVAPVQIAEVMVKRAVANVDGAQALLPGDGNAVREETDVIYENVAKIDSHKSHRNRDVLRKGIAIDLAARLDTGDRKISTITGIALRALNTAPTIAPATQLARRAQKQLVAELATIVIAVKGAEIDVPRAPGNIDVNAMFNYSLALQYVPHGRSDALKMFAENPGDAGAVPANISGFTRSLIETTLSWTLA